jgi:hypothetical protein
MAAEATAMRCGFDRLAERVKGVIGQDPLSGHAWLICKPLPLLPCKDVVQIVQIAGWVVMRWAQSRRVCVYSV